MYTKKKVLITMSRFASLIGFTIGLMQIDWLFALIFFGVLITFFFVFPALLTKLLLKKDEQQEVDGELYLWDVDGRIDYKLTINAVGEVPYKEYLKIRVNETARDESILSKKHSI